MRLDKQKDYYFPHKESNEATRVNKKKKRKTRSYNHNGKNRAMVARG